MMMRKTLGIFIVLLFIGVQSMAQQPKIGHVNPQKILPDLPAYKEMMETLEFKTKRAQKEIRRMDSTLNNLYVEYTELPEDAVSKKKIIEGDIRDMEQRLQEERVKKERELNNMQQQMTQDIMKVIQDAIDKVGKAGGYTYIIDASVMHYINGGNDLTDAVRKELGLPPYSEDSGTTDGTGTGGTGGTGGQ